MTDIGQAFPMQIRSKPRCYGRDFIPPVARHAPDDGGGKRRPIRRCARRAVSASAGEQGVHPELSGDASALIAVARGVTERAIFDGCKVDEDAGSVGCARGLL